MCTKAEVQDLKMHENVWIHFVNVRRFFCWYDVVYLIEKTTAQHVKWTFSGLVKVESHLGIDANTKIIVHVQFTMRQPFHRQSPTRITFNVNQPTIQQHGLWLLNLRRRGTKSIRQSEAFYLVGKAQTLSHISLGCKTAGGTAPQPSTRDKSLPVPIGRMQTSGKGLICRLKISVKIHPTVPSPPATKIRHWIVSIFLIRFSASSGPAELSSNIWIGFKTLRQMAITSAAALSPDLRFAKIVEAIGLHSFECPANFPDEKKKCSPTTINGFQVERSGGIMVEIFVVRRYFRNTLLGGMMKSLYSPKSHIYWGWNGS